MHSDCPTGPDLVAVNFTTPDASVTVRLDSFRQKVVTKGQTRWKGEMKGYMKHAGRFMLK